MKSFLISIHPEWIIKIFDGDKTAEIRRTAPKEWVDYLSGKTKKKPEPMTGYIYCTEPRSKEVLSLFVPEVRPFLDGRAAEFIERKRVDNPGMRWSICNGKVVAKFTLREVEQILSEAQDTYCGDYDEVFFTKTLFPDELLNASRLSQEELSDYGGRYAWHITDLQIFDEPKELSEFGIKRPPQSWFFMKERE